jgi:serine protease inhibitor ecotin
MKLVLILSVLCVLVGCATEATAPRKEPTVEERVKLLDKQADVPQAEKDGVKQLVQSYKDKDEFENKASH